MGDYWRDWKERKTSLIENQLLAGKIIAPNAIISTLFGYTRMRKQYETKQFQTRITASLNYIDKEDGKLKTRNLFCMQLEDLLFHNMEAVHIMQKAALDTTGAEDPIVNLPE